MAGSNVGRGGGFAEARAWQVVVWAVVGLLLAGRMPAQEAQAVVRVLASAGAVHRLSAEEAQKALPVHFRGVVTFYDPLISSLFVNDESGGVYVSVPWKPVMPLVEGTLVEVFGVSGPGEFAPIVAHGQVRILGQSHSPRDPPRVTVLQLATGTYDCGWVEVEGVVHSLSRVGHMISVRVATRDGTIVGLVPAQPGLDYAKWLDASVRLRGLAAAEYNKHKQMTGSHLFFQSMNDVQVLSYRRGDPFALPVRSISRLAQFNSNAKSSDGVHVRGHLVLQWPGRLLCVQDASGGLCVEDTSNRALPQGSLLDIFGYPVFAAETPALMDATVRLSVGAAESVPVQATTASAALGEEHSGELVSLEGKLVGVTADAEFWQLALVSQNVMFSAVLPKAEGAGLVAPWLDGSYVRVRGVCRNEVDARMGRDWTSKQRMASTRILLRSASDVAVLRKPSWWTPAHTIVTLSAVVVAMLAVFGWVVLLRRQVEQKTHELRESEQRFRHLAHHDSLTGVPNRAWFHERTEMALALSRRSSECVGLLLLDLDHFKPVNDTLGHDAGDAMLCALAERVKGAVRKVDTVARLGGDEFAVVLADVSGGEDAEMVANKILAAVCRPVTIKGRQVAMSASIGVAVFPQDGDTVTELLRSADLAMYESKKLARGGVRRYEHEISMVDLELMTFQGRVR